MASEIKVLTVNEFLELVKSQKGEFVGSSPRREVVWMNYNVDGQMDFSDFPELWPGERNRGVDNDV